PEAWEASGPTDVMRLPHLGVIVISQTQQVHEQIEELLASLRKKGSRRQPEQAEDENDPALYLRVHRLPSLTDYDAKPATAKPAGGGMFNNQPDVTPAKPEPAASSSTAPAPASILAQFGGGGTSADPRPLAKQMAKIIKETIEPDSW